MFEFDLGIICPDDVTATEKRKNEYRVYYAQKYELCRGCKPETIAEIGIRAGYSAWTFMQAAPKAKYFGFDANNGQHGGRGGEDGRYFDWAKRILHPYNVILKELDTQKIEHLDLPPIDFFHVDGDHSPAGVYHDLNLALHVISDRGSILVDDISYISDVKIGVLKFLDDHPELDWTFHPTYRGDIMITRRKE